MSSGAFAVPKPREEQIEDREVKREPPYHVILLDDDDHTFEYVIMMLKHIFGYPKYKGLEMAEEVHNSGRVIVYTGELEHAEFYKEQIEAFGPDKLIARCKGSMSAIIEQASKS